MLREFVDNHHVKFAQRAKDWKDAIRMSCEVLEADGTVDAGYKEEIIDCIEKYGPYIIITSNVAMPHSQQNGNHVHKTAIAFMKLEEPVSFDPEDPEKDAQLFFTLASCNPDQHLDNMQRLVEILMNDDLLQALSKSTCPQDLLEIQANYLDA